MIVFLFVLYRCRSTSTLRRFWQVSGRNRSRCHQTVHEPQNRIAPGLRRHHQRHGRWSGLCAVASHLDGRRDLRLRYRRRLRHSVQSLSRLGGRSTADSQAVAHQPAEWWRQHSTVEGASPVRHSLRSVLPWRKHGQLQWTALLPSDRWHRRVSE